MSVKGTNPRNRRETIPKGMTSHSHFSKFSQESKLIMESHRDKKDGER